MIRLSADEESLIKEPYASSMKVVAGSRNQRYLHLTRARVPKRPATPDSLSKERRNGKAT